MVPHACGRHAFVICVTCLSPDMFCSYRKQHKQRYQTRNTAKAIEAINKNNISALRSTRPRVFTSRRSDLPVSFYSLRLLRPVCFMHALARSLVRAHIVACTSRAFRGDRANQRQPFVKHKPFVTVPGPWRVLSLHSSRLLRPVCFMHSLAR